MVEKLKEHLQIRGGRMYIFYDKADAQTEPVEFSNPDSDRKLLVTMWNRIQLLCDRLDMPKDADRGIPDGLGGTRNSKETR